MNELPGEPGIRTHLTEVLIVVDLSSWTVHRSARPLLPRKEVIQPQVPLRLPCYDFTPITGQTLDGSLPKVGSPASGLTSFRGVTGGVYKARERIHRSMLICDY